MTPVVQTMEIAPGEAGIFQSLTAMVLAARKERVDPTVRAKVHELTASCAPTDQACKAAALYSFVKSRLDYVPDPEDIEAVGLASYHLANVAAFGRSEGDCDDGAVLLATLGAAAGFPVRYAVASFRDDLELHHVWTEFRVNGKWVNLDTFRSERLQSEPTRILYRVVA